MQEDISNSVWRVVTEPAAVALLFDREHRTRLAPFLKQAHTVGDVASQLAEDPKRTFYFVRRYCRLGLLRETRRVKRHGRALKYYRATAAGFYVPLEHFPNPDIASVMDDLYLPMLRTFNQAIAKAVTPHLQLRWGRRFRLDPNDTLIPEGGPDPRAEELAGYDSYDFYALPELPAAWTWWQEVYLTPEEAKAVQLELIALCRRLEASRPRDKKKRRYLIRTGMTEIE